MLIAPGSLLLFIGDSITDCGRARPAGGNTPGALGSGYVGLVDALLTADDPAGKVRVVNQGTGGHTVRDLRGRWDEDVLAHRPDWLVVMIGINDVWRQFDAPGQPERHVLPDEYEATLDALLARTAPTLPGGLVVLTPFFVEPDRADPMRALADRYGGIARTLAARHGARCADTQAAFDAALAHLPPATLAPDRVHPTLIGHMLLARTFLRAVDLA